MEDFINYRIVKCEVCGVSRNIETAKDCPACEFAREHEKELEIIKQVFYKKNKVVNSRYSRSKPKHIEQDIESLTHIREVLRIDVSNLDSRTKLLEKRVNELTLFTRRLVEDVKNSIIQK